VFAGTRRLQRYVNVLVGAVGYYHSVNIRFQKHI
jgi:hypothetical protein